MSCNFFIRPSLIQKLYNKTYKLIDDATLTTFILFRIVKQVMNLSAAEIEIYRPLSVRKMEGAKNHMALLEKEGEIKKIHGMMLPCYLASEYHLRDRSIESLAKELGISRPSVERMFNYFSIPKRADKESSGPPKNLIAEDIKQAAKSLISMLIRGSQRYDEKHIAENIAATMRDLYDCTRFSASHAIEMMKEVRQEKGLDANILEQLPEEPKVPKIGYNPQQKEHTERMRNNWNLLQHDLVSWPLSWAYQYGGVYSLKREMGSVDGLEDPDVITHDDLATAISQAIGMEKIQA